MVYLKKEVEKLIDERDVLSQRKQQKVDALEYIKPIRQQITQTIDEYKAIKAQNTVSKGILMEKER